MRMLLISIGAILIFIGVISFAVDSVRRAGGASQSELVMREVFRELPLQIEGVHLLKWINDTGQSDPKQPVSASDDTSTPTVKRWLTWFVNLPVFVVSFAFGAALLLVGLGRPTKN